MRIYVCVCGVPITSSKITKCIIINKLLVAQHIFNVIIIQRMDGGRQRE